MPALLPILRRAACYYGIHFSSNIVITGGHQLEALSGYCSRLCWVNYCNDTSWRQPKTYWTIQHAISLVAAFLDMVLQRARV